MANNTIHLRKPFDHTATIRKMKEILRDRAADRLVSIVEGTMTQVSICGDDMEIPVVTAKWTDGTIDELRLYYDPNAIWLAVKPGDDVRDLELYMYSDDEDPEYMGSWTVINGEIQW